MNTNTLRDPQLDKVSLVESGRVGYLVLWFLGAPVGLLLFLWVILGDNLFGAG